MARFAQAAPKLGSDLGWPVFVWLTGLLEGEGSFLAPVPSSPGSPIVSCRMTDRDVIERVASAFGTSVQANDKGRHKTEFAANLRGFPAMDLMVKLRPMMSARRQAAIDRAIASYEPPFRKLSFEAAEEIRRRRAAGESVSSLARHYGVARQTIHPILDYRYYRKPPRTPWLELSTEMPSIVSAGTGLSWAELYWLAGWLEGEGSFVRPPPSSPRAPRIHVHCCDEDVLNEVAHLLRVKPRPVRELRGIARGWSPSWRALLSGRRAIALMQAIRAIMSGRRQRQIDDAVAAAIAAGAPAGWGEVTRSRSPPGPATDGGEGI